MGPDLRRDSQRGKRPHIILAGAGHAHLYLLRHRQRLTGADVTLVEPSAFWYSGMAAGVLGGAREPGEGRVDPKHLARQHGAGILRGRVAALDPLRRQLHLENGRSLSYDLLSFNLGSCAPTPASHPNGPTLWPVKPIQQLVALRRRLEAAFARSQAPAIAVVGGGASGVELACNLHALAARRGAKVSVSLVSRQPRPLAFAPAGARRWLEGYLTRLGIQVYGGSQAVALHRDGLLITASNREPETRLIECEHVVHAGGLAPPPSLEQLGLPLIAGRGLAIADTLQSVADPNVFAAGDCAVMIDHPLPRLGVYGVRQAPLLLANLQARLRGLPLQRYTPQARALTILDLGQEQGLAIRGSLWWSGRLSLRWKRWLDERFVAQYRN
ncbi:NAD(P)/FAD-dependent oxidoreductase [Billgrantia sp. LNSP4103-1]|uniref:NAD(P)/FAD-dependent oxidoreductase n=1 Tax=Billgrantia sp. LNSP4103-1 TaxID=3410266 RepID=UPI00403F09B6